MCDRVSVTPEPEPSGELHSEPDTGGDSQYSVVIDDIGVTLQQHQSEVLPDLSFDVYGKLIVRDPGAGVSVVEVINIWNIWYLSFLRN